ncbi:MAG TPA: hypothetical protein VGM78_15690 [Ilumatobacteraceae bacterium]
MNLSDVLELSPPDFAEWMNLSPSLADRLLAFAEQVMVAEPARRRIRPLALATRLEFSSVTDDHELARRLRDLSRHDQLTRMILPVAAEVRTPRAVVLIVSTPRSGNSIVRLVISRLGHTGIAVHSPADIEWSRVPDRAVVQVHASVDEISEMVPADVNPRIVTMIRHPLDVLQSIRAYAPQEPETLYWLEGRSILDPEALADDRTFRRWARSEEAGRLLALSVEWARHPEAHPIRYEELVARPDEVVNELARFLDVSPVINASELLAAERAQLPTRHITHGGPGARALFRPSDARALRRIHRAVFAGLQYQ